MLISSSSPEFHNARDQRFYNQYIIKSNSIEKFRNDITSLIEKGESPDSEKIKLRVKELTKKKNALKVHVNNIRKSGSILASYLTVSNPNISGYKNFIIYKLFNTGKKLYAWKIENGKLTLNKLSHGKNSNSLDAISNFLKKSKSGKTSFVVLTNQFLTW